MSLIRMLLNSSNKAVLRKLAADSRRAARRRAKENRHRYLAAPNVRMPDAIRAAYRNAGAFFGKLCTDERKRVAGAAAKSVCVFIIVLGVSATGYGIRTNVGTYELTDDHQTEAYGAILPQSVVFYTEYYEYGDAINSGSEEKTLEEAGEAAGEAAGEETGEAAGGETGEETGEGFDEGTQEEPQEEPRAENREEPGPHTGSGSPGNVLVLEGMRYFTAEELRHGLLRELIPLAPAFAAAQEEYGIDAVFLAAIAALESGWGLYPINETNLFGFGNMSFETREAGVDHVAGFLRREYLTEGGRYYRGVSVAGVAHHYCPPTEEWPDRISRIMREIVWRIDDYYSQ